MQKPWKLFVFFDPVRDTLFKMFRKKNYEVTFFTNCYEKDFLKVLERSYLQKQIENHAFPFVKKILIINNVKDPFLVKSLAEKRVQEGILSDFIFTADYIEKVLNFFQLEKSTFQGDSKRSDDWVFFNALSMLTAIFICQTPYLLYLMGDVFLEKRIAWVEKALSKMEKNSSYKVANLTWNEKYQEVKKESYKKDGSFYVAKEGFSDQCFLVRTEDFKKPIYNELHPDAAHFPGGEVFEKRVYSFMKNHGWERITFKYGSYTHQNF